VLTCRPPARQVRSKVPTSPPDRGGIASGWSVATCIKETTEQTDRTTALSSQTLAFCRSRRQKTVNNHESMTSHEQGIGRLVHRWKALVRQHPSTVWSLQAIAFYVCMPGFPVCLPYTTAESLHRLPAVSKILYMTATAVSHRLSLSASGFVEFWQTIRETRQRLRREDAVDEPCTRDPSNRDDDILPLDGIISRFIVPTFWRAKTTTEIGTGNRINTPGHIYYDKPSPSQISSSTIHPLTRLSNPYQPSIINPTNCQSK